MKILLLILASIGITLGAWIGIVGSSFGFLYNSPEINDPLILLLILAITINPLTVFAYLHFVFKIKKALVRNLLFGLTLPFCIIAWALLLNAVYYRGSISYPLLWIFILLGTIILIGIYALIMLRTSKKRQGN